ncbi:MAG: ABC transporter ATP-binding protein [Candidatus Eremiobacterota bacterium]
MDRPLIHLAGVGLDYPGGVRALEGIDLEVRSGQFLAVVGPSGSGKTTLLNLIGGLDRATRGEVEVAGVNLGRCSDRQLSAFRSRHVGFIFQSFHLHPTRTALQNTMLPLYFRDEPDPGGRERCLELLARLGLQGLEHRQVARLSGGQRQRVAIARALVNRPSMVLADEPIGHLDGETASVVLSLLSEIHRTEQVTLVAVTHDLSILQVAERTVEMAEGRLVAR